MKPKNIILIISEPIILGFLTVYSIYVLRLGYFIPIVFGIAFIIACSLAYFRWLPKIDRLRLNKLVSLAILVGIYISSVVGTWKLCVDVQRMVTFPMTWTFEEPSQEWPKSKHIVLRFKDFPNHKVGIYSQDLGKYLDSQETKYVDVTFRTKWDFGQFRSYYQIKIGDLENWQSDWGYGGCDGEYEPSPWTSNVDTKRKS